MRYIEKKAVAPDVLRFWVARRVRLGLPVRYNSFSRKKELNAVLRAEQHGLCCYCQRPLTHYEPNYLPDLAQTGGAHNEHLYPENRPGDPKSQALQMEYTNLYACCVDSQGHKKRERYLRYCGEAKSNKLIRPFLHEPHCQQYFKYLSTGEIVPNGPFNTLREYEHCPTLTKDQQDALHAIHVLNLNCVTLKADRRQLIDTLLHLLHKRTRQQWQDTIDAWLKSDNYPSYIELRLQFINRYIYKKSL